MNLTTQAWPTALRASKAYVERHSTLPIALPLLTFAAFLATFRLFHDAFGPAAGSLAVVPALVATWWLGTRAGIVTGSAAVLVNMVWTSAWSVTGFVDWWVMRGGLIGFITLLLVVIGIGRLRVLERERAASARELRNLAWKLTEVQELQSRHLARELHDEIGQQLTGLKLQLENGGKEAIETAKTITRELIGRVRNLSMELWPSILDDLGLIPALRDQIKRFSAMTGVEVDLAVSGNGDRPVRGVEVAAYRIVQEALTNVARHSGVKAARVTVDSDGRRLRLAVEDSGQGLGAAIDSTDGAIRTHGIAGMRERALSVGGEMEIESLPGSGTRVKATLPLSVS